MSAPSTVPATTEATEATEATDTTDTTDTTTTATVETTVPAEPVVLDELGLLSEGDYSSDHLSLGLSLTTTTSFQLAQAHPGMIELVSLGSSPEAYRGVAFMVVDTLIDTDAVGRHRSRLPATADLDDFLASRDRIEVLDRRSDELGGLPAEVWRVGFSEPCDDCWFPTLFGTSGMGQWGNPPGYVQELWVIEAPGAPIIVAVEGPEASFDAWSDDVREHLFSGLQFGSSTGYSLQQPGGVFAEGFGEYAIGRAELDVVDGTRSTLEVADERGVVVPASDDRRLLLSVAYPSQAGGFGAEPADGDFPLVVVAPALFDAAIALPADRQLASHGFVVVTVRFPESSFPGSAVMGVPRQPADVSFVIDEIERGVLPADIASITDVERIGLLGHSGGATTGFGLLTYDCCQDTRIDAVVAHAGTPYDFDSTRVAPVAPILHVVSNGDQEISTDVIRTFHDETDGPSTLAVLDDAEHLQWLDPGAPEYDDAFDLVLAFLDQHLRDVQSDVAADAGSAFVEVSSR